MTVVLYDDILATVPKLSSTELRNIIKFCNAALSFRGAERHTDAGEDDWLLRGVLAELDSRGLYAPSGFKIRSGTAYKGYTAKAAVVRDTIERAAPDMDITQLRLMGEVAAHELARMITWKTLSLEVLLDNINLVPEALERSFPGYIAAGLLHLVIRRI